jgi:hypothetical protein
MQKRVGLWSMWLQVAILLSLVIGVMFWIAISKTAPTGKDDLKIAVAELRSHAAEGQLLAEQAMAKHLTSIYLRSHVSKLEEKVEAVIEQLSSVTVDQGLEGTRTRAKELATALNTSLHHLSDSFENQAEANALKNEMGSLFSQLMELENSLKP